MRCPECGGETRVKDKRTREYNRIYRRRECLICKTRFTTYEEVSSDQKTKIIYERTRKKTKKIFRYFKNPCECCGKAERTGNKYCQECGAFINKKINVAIGRDIGSLRARYNRLLKQIVKYAKGDKIVYKKLKELMED